MDREEAAQLIERFLEGRSLYPQEWNDFVDTSQDDDVVENYRRQCNELDPLVNRVGDLDPAAVSRLRASVQHLRAKDLA